MLLRHFRLFYNSLSHRSLNFPLQSVNLAHVMAKKKVTQKKITAFTTPKKPLKDEDDAAVCPDNNSTGEKADTRGNAKNKPDGKVPATNDAKRVTKKGAGKIETPSEEVEDVNVENDDGNEEVEEPAPKRKKAEPKNVSPNKNSEPKPMNQTATEYHKMNLKCTKKSPEGKDWNFKISSWNVVSLNALAKKNGLEFVHRESPDVMCFQETKCNEKNLPDDAKIEGYHRYFVSGVKPGYAGVALYSKTKPLCVKLGLEIPDHDSEGRIITAEYEKFYLVTTYVPNSGQGLKTLEKRLKWNTAFDKYVAELDKIKPVIICGDMNVAHQPIDLKNPLTNTKTAGYTQEERDGFTELLKLGFVDTFRKLNPDIEGVYTFWNYIGNARKRNAGWRIDYYLVSERLMNSVCDSVTRSQVYGSDHCPITLFLAI